MGFIKMLIAYHHMIEIRKLIIILINFNKMFCCYKNWPPIGVNFQRDFSLIWSYLKINCVTRTTAGPFCCLTESL